MIANPGNIAASFQFAQIASQQGRFRDAITALERVLVLDPTLSNIRLEIGVLYLRLGQSAIAEQFIRDAIADPAAPPSVRARGQELLDISERANDRLVTAFIVSGGVVYDSNANSGPDEGTNGVADTSTGQSDVSVVGTLTGRLSYDLGYQAGHRLLADVSLFTRGYAEQSTLDIGRLSARIGPTFNLSPGSPLSSSLTFTLDGTYFRRDGEDFLSEYGPTLSYARQTAERTLLQFSASYRDQNFEATTTSPANAFNTGTSKTLGAQIRHGLNATSAVTAGLRFTDKSAETVYDSYEQIALNAGYTVSAPALAPIGAETWQYAINGNYATRDYDGPDPAPNFGFTEESNSYVVSASVTIPFENDLSLRTEIGIAGNNSNFAINEYDNTFVSFTLTKSF